MMGTWMVKTIDFTKNHECQPRGVVRGRVEGSPKSGGFIVRKAWMSFSVDQSVELTYRLTLLSLKCAASIKMQKKKKDSY